MKNAQFLVRAALGTCLIAMPAVAFAGSASTSMSVTASVVNNCTVSAPAVAFGNWDYPTYGAANDDATQTVSFVCTKGAASVYVTADAGGNGTHASGTTRAMSDGAGDYLSYELYTDSGHTTVWNTTNSGGHTFAPSFAASHSASATVYARIPSGQDVPVGSYSDSVNVVINF